MSRDESIEFSCGDSTVTELTGATHVTDDHLHVAIRNNLTSFHDKVSDCICINESYTFSVD